MSPYTRIKIGNPSSVPINMIPAAIFSLQIPTKVPSQNTSEKQIHIKPFALLYAGISSISSSFTVVPDQNHIGFFLLHANTPIPVNKILQGIIIMKLIRFFIKPSSPVKFIYSRFTKKIPVSAISRLFKLSIFKSGSTFLFIFIITPIARPFHISLWIVTSKFFY